MCKLWSLNFGGGTIGLLRVFICRSMLRLSSMTTRYIACIIGQAVVRNLIPDRSNSCRISSCQHCMGQGPSLEIYMRNWHRIMIENSHLSDLDEFQGNLSAPELFSSIKPLIIKTRLDPILPWLTRSQKAPCLRNLPSFQRNKEPVLP
jgi:hypothetical protein